MVTVFTRTYCVSQKKITGTKARAENTSNQTGGRTGNLMSLKPTMYSILPPTNMVYFADFAVFPINSFICSWPPQINDHLPHFSNFWHCPLAVTMHPANAVSPAIV